MTIPLLNQRRVNPFHKILSPAVDEGVAGECWDVGIIRDEELFGDVVCLEVFGVEVTEGADPEGGHLLDGEVGEEAAGELLQQLGDLEDHAGVCHLL